MIHTTQPGDICNARGDIRGDEAAGDPMFIKGGRTIVTRDQAMHAVDFGWRMSRAEDVGMVTIERPA